MRGPSKSEERAIRTKECNLRIGSLEQLMKVESLGQRLGRGSGQIEVRDRMKLELFLICIVGVYFRRIRVFFRFCGLFGLGHCSCTLLLRLCFSC